MNENQALDVFYVLFCMTSLRGLLLVLRGGICSSVVNDLEYLTFSTWKRDTMIISFGDKLYVSFISVYLLYIFCTQRCSGELPAKNYISMYVYELFFILAKWKKMLSFYPD